jgi:ribosomal protein L40E
MQQNSQCPKCGAQNPPGQGFCSGCGAQMQQNCPNCNSLVDISARFCSTCGAGLGWGLRVKDLQFQLTAIENGLTQSSNDLQNQLKRSEDEMKVMIERYSEGMAAHQFNLNETARHIAGFIAVERNMSLGRKLIRIGSGIIALGLAAIGLSYVSQDIPYLAVIGSIVVAIGFVIQLVSNFIPLGSGS